MDVEELLVRQQEYYNARSADWESWITRYMGPVQQQVEEVLDGCPLGGDVLDLACGTGYWTEKLARRARTVTALDGSAPMLEQVGEHGLANVHTVQADLFSWNPPTQWDAVFFAHWLAHVPEDHFDGFWSTVDGALLPGGHVVVVDVAPEEARIEEEVFEQDSVPLTRRRLKDGRRFDVVKKYWEPDELIDRLKPLGWRGRAVKLGEDEGLGFVLWDLNRSGE